jgi:DNA-binding XRE family transcriptional regulator
MHSTFHDETVSLFANSADAALKTAAMQAASPIVLALQECDEELRAEAITLFKQLQSGQLDPDEVQATTALLAEILFPNTDHEGLPGLDLEESGEIAKPSSSEAKDVLERMDQEEATFATRLRTLMDNAGITQEQLAEKIGVGQPAISMMLKRQCRPQKRTVQRLAEALGVAVEELWTGDVRV